jgi:hypothetical protein
MFRWIGSAISHETADLLQRKSGSRCVLKLQDSKYAPWLPSSLPGNAQSKRKPLSQSQTFAPNLELATSPGAQTERREDAGPVRVLRGGRHAPAASILTYILCPSCYDLGALDKCDERAPAGFIPRRENSVDSAAKRPSLDHVPQQPAHAPCTTRRIRRCSRPQGATSASLESCKASPSSRRPNAHGHVTEH